MAMVNDEQERAGEEIRPRDRDRSADSGRLVDSVVGQERAKALLGAGLRAGKLAHAILITGPAGVGKSILAQAVAQALLCSEPDPSGWGCSQCRDCRLVAAGSHPDLHLLQAEGGQRIGLDSLRNWIREVVALRPAQAGYSVGVLTPADMLTDAGQNMLLKSLEEPPTRVKWVLVTESPAGLLPTVRSRCQQVALAALPVELVEMWLIGRGVQQEVAASAARLAGGRPLVAWQLSRDEAVATRQAVVQWVCRLRDVPVDQLFQEAQGWAEAKDLAVRLETMAFALRDLALAGSGQPQIMLVPELKERLANAEAVRVPEPERFLGLAQEAYQLSRRVGQAGSARLGVEALFLQVRTAWRQARLPELRPAQRG